ncbi:Protein ABHD16A [Daphnia magna]|uniref:Protein ABHD16A n=1 Tax=Daphnia magna TaxID=35525 RepID=A0A162NQT7_9CRUS|nr:Protein ABHD16A [Daphnia magna]
MAAVSFIKCLLGPRLIKIYASSERNAISYVPSGAEKFGDGFLKLINWSLQLGFYTSPFVIWVLHKKNYFGYDGLQSLMRFTAICSFLCASSLVARAFGRLSNPHYIKFINHLEVARVNYNSITKKPLSQYDFEFSAWPVDYDAKEIQKDSDKPRIFIDEESNKRSITEIARVLPCRILGYMFAHTIGIRLLYPGTIIQHFIDPHLVEGRSRLIEELQGERYKLMSRDENSIDCIAVDRRGKPQYSNGHLLVICCEGNAGFYELGMIGTPLEAGYSVLGWNHPGFGGSSGTPFPRQDQNAIDIVVQFALNKLNFPAEHIIIYGWSIGGFTASWAAMNYPNIRGVMLDATFDHVLPLAANVMPSSWKSIVATTVKHNLNLNVADQLIKYSGPIVIFRRTRDEVIALEPGTLSSNRGNDLLIKLLKFRFPHIVDHTTIPTLRAFLNTDTAEREEMIRNLEVSHDPCIKQLKQYAIENRNSFPMRVGQSWSEKKKMQMASFLASRHMLDFDSTHCTPLPAEMFRLPQEIGYEADSVEISDFAEISASNL